MKKLSDSTQMKAGAMLSYVQIFISVLTGLFYTPVMLRLMGQQEYGLYGTVSSAIDLLGLLNLGFTSSYIRFYSTYKNAKQPEKINSFNSLFFYVFFVISVIAAFIGFFLASNPSMIFDEGLTPEELSKAKTMMILLTVSTILGFLTTVFNCFVFANQKFIFSKSLTMISSIISIGLNLSVLYFGHGAIGLITVSLILCVITNIFTILYACKNLDFKFDFKNVEPKLFKSVMAFSGLIAINMFVDKVNSGIDSILLGRFCGTAAVAVYSVGASLNSNFSAFSTAISGIFTPHIHNLVNSYEMDSKEQRKALTDFFVKVGRIQYLLLALIASGVVFFGKPFIYFWAGPGYDDSYYIALILIIPSIISLTQNVGIEIQRAENRHHYRAYIYGAMAVMNLIVSIFLCQIWEGIGSAVGTGFASLIANGLIMDIVYHKKINIDITSYWKNIGRQTLGMIVPFAAGAAIMKFAAVNTIFELIVWIIIYSLVYCVCVWLFSMNNYEKELVKGFMRKIRKVNK